MPFQKKRITPLIVMAASLFLVAHDAHAEENLNPKPIEMIVCPNPVQAEQGTLLDEYYLGRAYDKGYCGFPIDKKAAEGWYMKAAKQGHMLAQYEVAEIYFAGDSVSPPNYPKAKQWYMAAAKQGHGLSQLRLGFLFAEAHFKGLTTDYKEAEAWFSKAAEQDAGDARFRLGNFYHNYKDPPDMQKAVHWLRLAAEGGHRIAMFDLARLLKKEQKNEEALTWMKRSGEKGLLPAQMALSDMHLSGDGAPKSPEQSFIWTLKIATAENAPTFWMNKAGDAFFSGWEHVPQDYTHAHEFYDRAAARNDAHAMMRLGHMYRDGLGVEKDAAKAHAYLVRAEQLGDKEAAGLLKGKTDEK